MTTEIVEFPIEHGDFPQLCESLPEGSQLAGGWWFVIKKNRDEFRFNLRSARSIRADRNMVQEKDT